MSAGGRRLPHRSRYRVGDVVRVRAAEQIAATLSADGTVDGLPFMPEMAELCGQTFVVSKSAHKTCDSEIPGHLRAMRQAVHLEGVHCSGADHGGCQSRCPAFWKDAWLEPAPGAGEPTGSVSGALRAGARRSLRIGGRDPERGSYSCQGTEVHGATVALPFWSLRQYWDDVRSGNVTPAQLVRGLPVILFNKFQYVSRRILPAALRIRGGRLHPNVVGTGPGPAQEPLGLTPGDEVEIRTHGEVLATLDQHGGNRGLGFDLDMVPFCGRSAVVHHRVEVRIDERTGELRRLRNPCVVLDGVRCRGRYHRFCPRGLDAYWREEWLKRSE